VELLRVTVLAVSSVGTFLVRVIGACSLITFRVSRRRREMYIGHARLSVCECVCVCLSVYLSHRDRNIISLAAFPHYCTDPDVTWGNGRECPVVVHYLEDLQSVHGFRCYDNIAPNAKCQRVLVLAVCPVSTG